MMDRVYKLEIFLPPSHFEAVRQALWAVDAGHIGAYDRCLSWSRAESCWRPLEGTDPFLGTPGELCRAEEWKEMCIRDKCQGGHRPRLHLHHPRGGRHRRAPGDRHL